MYERYGIEFKQARAVELHPDGRADDPGPFCGRGIDAAETAKTLDVAVERMRRGERQRFLVGTGHGGCTCEGAAFEYIVNLEFELGAQRDARRSRDLPCHNRSRMRRLT